MYIFRSCWLSIIFLLEIDEKTGWMEIYLKFEESSLCEDLIRCSFIWSEATLVTPDNGVCRQSLSRSHRQIISYGQILEYQCLYSWDTTVYHILCESGIGWLSRAMVGALISKSSYFGGFVRAGKDGSTATIKRVSIILCPSFDAYIGTLIEDCCSYILARECNFRKLVSSFILLENLRIIRIIRISISLNLLLISYLCEAC